MKEIRRAIKEMDDETLEEMILFMFKEGDTKDRSDIEFIHECVLERAKREEIKA